MLPDDHADRPRDATFARASLFTIAVGTSSPGKSRMAGLTTYAAPFVTTDSPTRRNVLKTRSSDEVGLMPPVSL